MIKKTTIILKYGSTKIPAVSEEKIEEIRMFFLNLFGEECEIEVKHV